MTFLIKKVRMNSGYEEKYRNLEKFKPAKDLCTP